MKHRARKKLQLGRETVRPLLAAALSAIRGGRMTADDGTMSGYPVCRTFYASACAVCDTDECDTSGAC